MSRINDIGGRNAHISYFIHDNMNDTKNAADSTSPATESMETLNWLSNQSFEVTNYHRITQGKTDVKVESQPFVFQNASPSKRAKASHPDTTNAPTRPSSKSKGKQKKSLSLVLEMPLDVLFEIFSHLQPRDMINLTRTSKIFRENLLSRSATTVWRAVCEREGAPECPNWMSEPAWAALLFEHVCQSCGARNIQKVDFLLLKRVCLKCKKLHLINTRGIFRRYPEACGHNISRLLPATNISSWSHTYTRKSNFYWDTDVEDLIMRLSVFRRDIEGGIPNAQKLLDDFKDDKMRKVEHIKEKFNLWNSWLTNKQSAKRIACILENHAASMQKALINSHVFQGIIGPPVPLIPENISFDIGDWLDHMEDDINFERDFGQWFADDDSDISLETEGSDLCKVDRVNDQWYTEADFDWTQLWNLT